ncbi:MAG: hypothetical protein ACOCW2_04255 [Chitinivibrionales bacterium]
MQVYKNDPMWSQLYETGDYFERDRTSAVMPRSGRRAISDREESRKTPVVASRVYRKRTVKQAGAYFETLSKAAHYSNKRLARLNRPFRLTVSQHQGRVMLDVEQVDARGAVSKRIRRDITHDEFVRWIDDVAHIQGIMVDELA